MAPLPEESRDPRHEGTAVTGGVASRLETEYDVARASPARPQRPDVLQISAAVVGVLLALVALGTGNYTSQGQVLIAGAVLAVIVALLPTRASRASAIGQWALRAVAVVLVALLASSTFLHWPDGLVEEDPTGQFDQPDNGETVASPLTVTGTADIPDGMSLWVLIQPPDNRLYTTDPSPVQLSRNGEWLVQGIGIGRGEKDIGRSYTLYLVAVPEKGDPVLEALRNKDPNRTSGQLDRLPREAKKLDDVRLQLGSAQVATAAASLIRPADADVVPLPTESRVEGMLSTELPAGHTIWVAQRKLDEELYHPMDVPCSIRGNRFDCPRLYLGTQDDRNERFDVFLWMADASATSELSAHGRRPSGDYKGIERPAGAQEMDRVSVVRS